MSWNFSLVDIYGTLLALSLIPIFLFLPGYTLGWVLDLVSFRAQTSLLRACLSVPLSLSLTPVLLYLVGREFTAAAIWVFYSLIVVGFLVILGFFNRQRNPRLWPTGAKRFCLQATVAWAALAVFTLIDLQLDKRLYYAVVGFDYAVRSSAVSALTRTVSYPPPNPFFFTGQPSPFRYHYFWFLICSLPGRLLSLSGNGRLIHPRQALIAGVVVVGLALLCVTALYLRFVCPAGALDIRRRTIAAAALLMVSGLDILFCVGKLFSRLVFHKGRLYPTVDWWNPEEVTGWVDSALWVPHHLAGLLACLVGFLILWHHPTKSTLHGRWKAIFASALAFASACGLSVYVTFVFAICLSAWCLVLTLRKRWQDLFAVATAGIFSIILAAPFLMDLTRAGSAGTSQAENSSFLRFDVRAFEPILLLTHAIHREYSPVLLDAANLVALPLNYFLEFGVFFVIGAVTIRQWRAARTQLSDSALAGAVALVTALLACTFLRSNTIANNDLGMRGMLIVQFVLLIWGAEWFATVPRHRLGWLLSTTLVLGLCTNVYEIVTLRFFTVLADTRFDPGENIFFGPGSDLGRLTFENREAYDWLDRNTPVGAVEQQFSTGGGDFAPGLYSNRQIGQLDYGTGVAFGADPAQSKEVEAIVRSVFEKPGINPFDLCRAVPIDYLIARSLNPAWGNTSSWIWHEKPIFQNRSVRVFQCPVRTQIAGQ